MFDQLASFLDQGLQELRLQQVEMVTGRFKLGSIWYYTVEWKKGDPKQIRHTLAKEIAGFLTEKWEWKQIEQKLIKEYTYYDADEVKYLADNAVKWLAFYHRAGAKDFRKKEIENEIQQYLAEHSILHVEGFIQFRLRAYLHDRARALEQAIDDYLMDREQHEFVNLLRYFLHAQESESDLVHLLVNQEGARLLDEKGLPITREDLLVSDLQRDDMLISTLITLAPKQVKIHQPAPLQEDHVLVDTVKRVFDIRAQTCSGCTLCQTPLDSWDQTDDLPLDYLK